MGATVFVLQSKARQAAAKECGEGGWTGSRGPPRWPALFLPPSRACPFASLGSSFSSSKRREELDIPKVPCKATHATIPQLHGKSHLVALHVSFPKPVRSCKGWSCRSLREPSTWPPVAMRERCK